VSAVYLETSAVLRWLFGEPDAPAIARRIEEASEPVCSALTLLEANRALIRAERERRGSGGRLHFFVVTSRKPRPPGT